ncbi:MAG: hypothetical protein PHC54_07735, partial [Candidatus Omnitrophica bacterium]|nr:hypothetical protein [Candidatus Omnitrophota bacterium]
PLEELFSKSELKEAVLWSLAVVIAPLVYFGLLNWIFSSLAGFIFKLTFLAMISLGISFLISATAINRSFEDVEFHSVIMRCLVYSIFPLLISLFFFYSFYRFYSDTSCHWDFESIKGFVFIFCVTVGSWIGFAYILYNNVGVADANEICRGTLEVEHTLTYPTETANFYRRELLRLLRELGNVLAVKLDYPTIEKEAPSALLEIYEVLKQMALYVYEFKNGTAKEGFLFRCRHNASVIKRTTEILPQIDVLLKEIRPILKKEAISRMLATIKVMGVYDRKYSGDMVYSPLRRLVLWVEEKNASQKRNDYANTVGLDMIISGKMGSDGYSSMLAVMHLFTFMAFNPDEFTGAIIERIIGKFNTKLFLASTRGSPDLPKLANGGQNIVSVGAKFFSFRINSVNSLLRLRNSMEIFLVSEMKNLPREKSRLLEITSSPLAFRNMQYLQELESKRAAPGGTSPSPKPAAASPLADEERFRQSLQWKNDIAKSGVSIGNLLLSMKEVFLSSEDWLQVLGYLKHIELLYILGILSPGRTIYNLFSGCDFYPGIAGNPLVTYDCFGGVNFLKEHFSILTGDFKNFLEQHEPAIANACYMDVSNITIQQHRSFDIVDRPRTFRENLAAELKPGDIIWLKHVEGYAITRLVYMDGYSRPRAKQLVLSCLDKLPVVIPEKTHIVIFESLDEGQEGIGKYFLGKGGMFRDELKVRLNPEHYRMLEEINRINEARVARLTIGQVEFPVGGKITVLKKVRCSASPLENNSKTSPGLPELLYRAMQLGMPQRLITYIKENHSLKISKAITETLFYLLDDTKKFFIFILLYQRLKAGKYEKQLEERLGYVVGYMEIIKNLQEELYNELIREDCANELSSIVLNREELISGMHTAVLRDLGIRFNVMKEEGEAGLLLEHFYYDIARLFFILKVFSEVTSEEIQSIYCRGILLVKDALVIQIEKPEVEIIKQILEPYTGKIDEVGASPLTPSRVSVSAASLDSLESPFSESPILKPFNINEPGLLVHGTHSSKLEQIMREGLKFDTERSYVSLAMLGKYGYRLTSTSRFGWGAAALRDSSVRKDGDITFVIDPTYVQANKEQFIAVGKIFSPTCNPYEMKQYLDSERKIIGGFTYDEKQIPMMTMYDEVITKSIPAEALTTCLIVGKEKRERLHEFIDRHILERILYVFDTNANLLCMLGENLISLEGAASPFQPQVDPSPVETFGGDLLQIDLRTGPRLAPEPVLLGACVGGRFGNKRLFSLDILDDQFIRNFLRYRYARP